MKLLDDTQERQRIEALLNRGVFFLLAAYLLFAHGCHGDKDNELFTRFAAQEVQEK